MNEPAFKKVRNGYDPTAVANFLMEMNQSFEQQKEQLNDEIKSLTAELANQKEKNTELENEFSSYKEAAEAQLQAKEDELTKAREIALASAETTKRAQEIILNANERADEMIRLAQRKSAQQSLEIVQSTKDKCDSVSLASDALFAQLRDIQSEVNKTQDCLYQTLEQMRREIGEYQ